MGSIHSVRRSSCAEAQRGAMHAFRLKFNRPRCRSVGVKLLLVAREGGSKEGLRVCRVIQRFCLHQQQYVQLIRQRARIVLIKLSSFFSHTPSSLLLAPVYLNSNYNYSRLIQGTKRFPVQDCRLRSEGSMQWACDDHKTRATASEASRNRERETGLCVEL